MILDPKNPTQADSLLPLDLEDTPIENVPEDTLAPNDDTDEEWTEEQSEAFFYEQLDLLEPLDW